MPALEFRDVSFTRPGGTRVLEHFNLAVDEGDVVALVGRSGAGKTTILKLINRLLEPDSGDVLVEGRSTRSWEPIRLRRRVGYVLQDVGLFPHMTVSGNIGVVPRLERWTDERITARVERAARSDRPRRATFAERWPDELSGGQRQRVGVARALAVDPPVLLMDEPFGALDPITRVELHDEFARIQARVGKTVIIVTHDMREAFALATRIGVLDRGQLVAWDTPDSLQTRRRSQSAAAARHMTKLLAFLALASSGVRGTPGSARPARRGVHRGRDSHRRSAWHLRVAPSAAGRAARRHRQHRADDSEPRDVRLPAAGAAHRRRRRPRGDRRPDPVRPAADRADDDHRASRASMPPFARPAWRWA